MYLTVYNEVAVAGIDPVYHFCGFGWREGFNPNSLFDTNWYLLINHDVVAAGINPLYHYIRFGELENRKPAPDFDPDVWRTANLAPPNMSCLGAALRQKSILPRSNPRAFIQAPDFITRKIITASALFDTNYYLINYPDVRESELDPLDHFCRYGWQEGRRPNSYFDPAWYAGSYLSESAQNPLLHYICTGERAGCRPIVYFDPAWYRTEYAIPHNKLALQHFLTHRREQNVSPISLFNVAHYVGLYGTELGSNRDPFAHYLRVGISQDVDIGPDFSPAAYRAAHMLDRVQIVRPHKGVDAYGRLRREALNPLVHFLLFSRSLSGDIPSEDHAPLPGIGLSAAR